MLVKTAATPVVIVFTSNASEQFLYSEDAVDGRGSWILWVVSERSVAVLGGCGGWQRQLDLVGGQAEWLATAVEHALAVSTAQRDARQLDDEPRLRGEVRLGGVK